MASHPRDSASEVTVAYEKPAKDPRVPLAEVCFVSPTKIPGLKTLLTTLVAGERRLVDGMDWYPPALWFDPVRREICIERTRYPMERVHYYVQAPAALTKVPPPTDLDKYTLGKRPKL